MQMKKAFRLLNISLIMLLVIVFALAGCSKSNTSSSSTASPQPSATPTATSTTGIDISKPVVLKMVLLGKKPTDFDLVYAQVNKLLKQKANATLDVSFIDWGDVNQKYPLMFAANEDFDIAFTASWAKYSETANKNGFLNLTPELLQKYAPQTWEKEPKAAWEQAKINGNIYMVPNDTFEVGSYLALIRGDLREKYNVPPIKNVDDLTNYLKTVAKNDKDLQAWAHTIQAGDLDLLSLYQPNNWYWGGVDGGLVDGFTYNITDTSGKIFSVFDTPEYPKQLQLEKDLADNGVWSKNAIVSKDDRTALFTSGKTAMMTWNLKTLSTAWQQVNKDHPDWKPEIVDVSPDAKRYVNSYLGNGIGIHATSKNPERALMVLDLLRYDKEIHDLTNYGIKGVHWDAVGDNEYKVLADSPKFPPSAADPWGWNSQLERDAVGAPRQYAELIAKWKQSNIIINKMQMFSFNDANVKTEQAAIDNVFKTYLAPLQYGLVDPVTGLATLKQKLKEAGIDKVQAELQTQLDAFMKQHQ